MRNHPSIIYLRDHPVSLKQIRDITLALKVHLLGNVQYLVAAISVTHPDESMVTEEMTTDNGLDSYPVPLLPPKGKYPFVKAEGRTNALLRMEGAIALLEQNKTSFRGPGVFAIANNHPRVVGSGTYSDIDRFVHVGVGEVFPLLGMSKKALVDMAVEMFDKEKDNYYYREVINLGFAFNSEEI
jgi:hypothetical protein